MRVAAKKRFRNSWPGNCSSCGKWIKCDKYRNVATYNLDLGQLWRYPESWCTVWKGTPQDCMDHIRRAHDVPWDIKSASLEKFFSPWTVQRQIWMDALKPYHSWVSTDVLLFSDINLLLAHHYRVFKRGLPHLAFRKDYLTCLRVFVSQATALAQYDMASPVPPSLVSARHARSSEVESELPRKTRRARRRMRPTCVRDEPVGVESPTLTIQNIPDLTGAIIYDCRPPLLPVSLRLKDIGQLPRTRPVASASLAAPPPEDSMVIGGASPEGVAVQELGVAPPDDSGRDLEDELLTPEDSMVIGGASLEWVAIPELGVAPLDDSETDLEDEFLNISHLPTIVSPLTEPVEALPVSPSLYPELPIPAQPDPVPSIKSRDILLREADEVRQLTCSRRFLFLPLSPTMIRPPPRSHRTYRMTLDSCRRTVRLLWTSTLRRMQTCCWGIRRTCPSFRCRYSLFRLPMFRIRCRSCLLLSGSQFWCPRWCRRTCLRRAPLLWIRLLRGRGTLPGC